MEKFSNIEEQRECNDPKYWGDGGEIWSTPFGGTEKIWNDHIFDKVKPFRGKKILEIDPGGGRMTQFLSILASELSVVDLNKYCIEITKKKLSHHIDNYYINDGKSLSMINDGSIDLVFSFDSFVHMHQNVIEDYISEISRVLVVGGYGFIHHSWFGGGEDLSFCNKGGRSNMNPDLFKNFVEDNGMKIISQDIIEFGDILYMGNIINTCDVISLFIKN